MTSRQEELERLIDEYEKAEENYLLVFEKTTRKSPNDNSSVELPSSQKEMDELTEAEEARDRADNALTKFRQSGSER